MESCLLEDVSPQCKRCVRACVHLIGRTVKLCVRRAKLDQRHKAHCLAFPVLGLVPYRMTVIIERLLGPG